ncbi:MAG: hypothetical protein U0871_15460 [Gemmataceae bacterium]
MTSTNQATPPSVAAGGDNWKRSESFSRDGLPFVAKTADRVYTGIFEQTGASDGMTQ